MKKIVLTCMVAAGMLSSTPAAADISLTRSEEIFNYAKVVCPRTFLVEQNSDYITREATARGYDTEEKVLLLNFCLMWSYGYMRR